MSFILDRVNKTAGSSWGVPVYDTRAAAPPDSAWKYIAAGDIKGLNDYTDREYNYHNIPYVGQFIGHAANNATIGLANAAQFVGANNVGDYLYKKGMEGEAQLPDYREPELSLSYLTDPNGLISAGAMVAGSMASMAPVAALAPVGGIAAGAARAVSQIPKVGLFASRYVPGAVRWATTGPVEAMMEGGGTEREMLENGVSPDAAREASWDVFRKNAGLLTATNALEGGLFGKAFIKAPTFNSSAANAVAKAVSYAPQTAMEMLLQGYEEGAQQGIQDAAMGKGENSAEQILNPLQWTDEQLSSAKMGFAGGLPLVGGSAIIRHLGSSSSQASAQGDPAPMQVKSSGNADIDSIITDVAAELNVPVNLIHAVAQTESGYNQDARSEAGAIGVMQLMPETAEGLGVDPTDLRGNIYGGAKYLRQLMDTFGGDMQKVIAAYNAGPGAVQKHGGIPPYAETQDYVQKVMGNLEGYDLGASGDVPVQVRSLADDAAPFIGVTMDNGTEGCVEAVTKIGANSSAFLAQELKNGVVNVDRLVEDAGENVIAFDPNQLEEGDVIVYGDESDPQRHVVLYDGKGGYIGNSSSRNQVVQGSDYNQMGDWHPTKIIKSGASFSGSSVRSISAPQMDFTGLVFDEKDIAATQKALNNLVHGGQPTPEQSAAILSAAEAIRDMPIGSVDKTAEAESYNEWQKLIDTKDIAGIVDKDPEGVARMVHQLAGAQKQQQTRAAIENQQQIEATKQALEAVQKQRYEAAQARINNAVAQRNAAMQNPQMQAETPMQGAVQTPQIPMQTAPTNNIVGDTVVENAAPQTFSSPVEEAVKNLPVSREELSDILGKVQQWEQPLLSIPAYVQARDRQDWATAAQIAANAGQPGVAQFYNTLMEHGSRNAQNVTPAPQENAPTVTPYAPQENVVAAPPVQNASAPIPVVGVRPLVPERLPDSTTGRRDLAHALGRFMMANNIPVSKGLRDDLSIGYRKAILYADEKIRKWENERAGNAPQTAQGGAQSTKAQADDRMLAQRGERAQNGSKAVRGKSAQKQGNKKAADKGELVLADGYETESGRPLSEADPQEFIIKPNGSRNFGEITKAVSDAVMEQSGENLPIGEIRLRVGNSSEGLIHAKAHEKQAQDAGYDSVEDMIADVAENFDRIYMRPPAKEGQRPTYSLVKSGNKSKGIMNGVAPIYFELQTDGSGNYYIVVTAIPKGDKNLGHQTKKDRLIYSSPGLGAATESNAGAVSASAKKVGADTRGGTPASDKSGDLDTSTISPEEAESKENPLHEDEQTALKGLSADAKDVYRLVRDKLADSSNKKVARAASVGAVLLARHADIIARKIRTTLGKPFTAMDYYRNMFALKTEGDKTGANVLHQAANAGGKMYAQSATDVPSTEKEAVRKQYEGTEQWMKAPNGKPTNLTEDQWIAVRTPAFKAWFGDWENDPENASKVVDENGEPLVVYHGTPLGGFDTFKRQQNYFTSMKWYADRYQDESASSNYIPDKHESPATKMTYAVFLNIKKPFDTRNKKERGIFEKEFYRQWGYGAPLSEKGLPDWTDGDDLQEFFEEKGYEYDGLILDEGGIPDNNGGVISRGISYVSFEPNQIKSATDNNGAFSPDDANIYHQKDSLEKNVGESAHAIPLDDGQGKVVDIQFVDVDEKRALQSPHIGIRFSDEEYKLGDDVENSHNWVDGNWTDEELDGASTVNVAEPWSYDSLDELKETAIKRLNKAGRYPYDYAYLVAGTSSDYGEDTNESIIRNAEVVGILKLVRESEAESFNQQMNEVIKGTTQDIPNGQRIISLFEAADESTFLHEMGHLFLLDLEHLAPMSPTAEKDLATVKKWAEWREGLAAEYKGTPFAHSFADLDKKIRAALLAGNDRRADNLKRQWEHERFARGFEMYLKTGDAPTKGLRAVFAKFRAFLQRVYQAFTGTGGKATPEVEAVMARMISIEDSSDLSAYPRGKETEVYTDSGKSIPVQYRVVSADDLIASHDASALEINPGYPSALQPRDRERVVMRQQVERMSNTLRPEELGEGRNLNQGAPLIRSDGVVLNGNGRTIAIARAQARNKERAAAYRDYLMENAETFGLSREAVEHVDNPVLVREVQGDISADTMNDIIGSTTGGSRMGASENAQADADKLTHTVMDTYVPNEKGDLTTAANRDFVAGVLHKVVGQGELNAYLDKDGHVNADGIQRVKRALFAAAYGDDEIVAKMAESTDDDTRNVSNGLMAAAPMMARLSVKKDVPYMRELRDAIADAVKQLDTLRRSGDSVKDYLGAQALFSEHEDSAEMREILSFLDENKRSGRRIGNYFTHIAEALDGMENPTDSDLFETQLPSLMDVLEEAKTHAETGGQDGLFGDNAQEVTDKNTQSAPLPDVQSPKRNVQNDHADMAQEEAEGKQKPTLGLFFQTEPALEKAALEYGAKSENGKVTFADAAQEKEFLQVAKALLSAGARKFSKAWTGSAADYDVPSIDYVGTGTGGAAYGYGLYYAEKRKTAEGYGDKLYHAEIPDADVLLDAGKSFDEQPPKVRKALEKLVRGLTLEQLENWNDVRRMGKAKVVAEIMDALSEADGTNIYGTISDLVEGQKEASELLNKYGVKGAVYNDEQNGRTFVVFDDKAIKILEKFSTRRQEELKKMLDGITLVSPNRLSPRKRVLRDWGHEMGVPVVFFKGDPSLHGFHSDGVTFLNVDSEITPQWTFWHEAMHWMKANNPDLYNDIVHEISGAEGFTKEQLDAYRKEIGAEHMSDADVIEEMIADALPDVRRRVPLLRDVGKRDTGIVERLVAWVHDVMRRFHDHFFTPKGGLTNDQRRAMVRAFGNLVGSIRDADGKQIFRVANDGARITLRDGKPLPAVKYSLDNKAGAGDNGGGRNLGEARKEAICSNVLARMKARVQDMLEQGVSWDEIHKEMNDENSTSREEALRVFKTQWNIFNSPRVNKRNIVERITKREGLTDKEVNDLFGHYKSIMKEMLDYGGFIYKEAALQQRGAREFLDGVHSWRSLERANREHGGSAYTGNEEKLNNNNRSDNQDGFSMPKFSARTNGESRVGNFRRMMDALKSGVKPSPRVEVHDGRREVTADIGVSQVKRFMKDKRLTDDEVISRRELPNGKVRITYYARSAMDIGYADQAKSVRQVAKRNPFVKALYDLASKAMHKQEKLRNDFAKSLKEFAELVKNPADMEKVTEILWTGDATGKEYTSAELRAAGASDNVVRAYTLVRRELKKAYELLNETRMQVKTRSKVLRPEDVESYMQSHWIRPSDVLSKTQTQDGNIELTWRGGKTYETKNKLMSAEELSLMEKDENINVTRAVPANAKAYGAGMYHVGYVERIKPINNLTGYMPHFFHEWMVYEQYKDPVSKEIRYTSVGSGRTLNEAVKIGNTIAEKNKDRNYVVRPKGFDMDAGDAVVVGDMEFAQMAKKLTESTQMSLADARTFLRESAGATLKSRHRFFGNMMKRKGAEGFDKNIMWVLAHYFNSSARYIAMEEFKPAAISFYERCFGAFDSDTKNMTARYCKDLINDVNGNPRGVEVWLNDLIKGTWLGKRIADSYGDRAALAVNGELSTWNAITKLGLFNFASAAVNFSQFINVGAALNDYGYAAKGLLRALHPSALDEKIIEASGLLEDINLAADNGGYSQRRGGRAGTVYQKAKQFGEWTLTPFQKADTLMRKAAVLGAYYQWVEKKGMEKAPGDELSAKAIAYAQQINDDANFDYSAANAPGMLRAGSVITQQLFQFQKYPIMQFEFMYNILKNGTRGQKVRMLVPYVLFCGIGGSIPFGELFNQLFSFLFGIATGDDEDIARDIKAEILRWAGKDPVKKSVAETALYGVLAPTFGLDISGRIGMSNAFSGEFYGQKPDSVSGVVAQQLGGPMAATAINMLHQAHEGNPIEALKAVSPALGNMAQAYVGVSRTTHHRVNTRYDSAYDKIAHALGFRSVEESTNAFVMNYDYEMRTKDKHTKQDAIQSYIDDPSDANRRTLNALGIKDRQVKEAQIQQERTAKERAKNGRPNTNGKNRSSQHKKEEKRETLLSATDDEE